MISRKTAKHLGWLQVDPEHQVGLRMHHLDALMTDRLIHNDNAGDWRLTQRGRRELSRYRCDLRDRLTAALARAAAVRSPSQHLST